MATLTQTLASHAVQQVATTLLDLAVAAAIPFAIRYVNNLTHAIRDERLRAWVQTQVLAVEQQFAGVMSNEQKQQAVIVAVRERFPKVPEAVIKSALEASVKAMKSQGPVVTAGVVAAGENVSVTQEAPPAP